MKILSLESFLSEFRSQFPISCLVSSSTPLRRNFPRFMMLLISLTCYCVCLDPPSGLAPRSLSLVSAVAWSLMLRVDEAYPPPCSLFFANVASFYQALSGSRSSGVPQVRSRYFRQRFILLEDLSSFTWSMTQLVARAPLLLIQVPARRGPSQVVGFVLAPLSRFLTLSVRVAPRRSSFPFFCALTPFPS